MWNIFSLVVLAAFFYLVQQQFPQETRDVLEWTDARVEALASRVYPRGDSREDGSPDVVESGARAVAESSEPKPTAGRIEVAADSVIAPEEEPGDAGARTPIRREPPADERMPPAIPETFPPAQVAAARPMSPDAERRIEPETARLRRDALAALAERMETLAIERAP